MSKLLSFWILILLLVSCKSQNVDLPAETDKSDLGIQFEGKVSRLDSIGSYHLIYAENEDSYFKIVTKKENISYSGTKIKIGNIYGFKLIPVTDRKATYELNEGELPKPINFLDITTCKLFGKTEICTESSYELAMATNVNGLYIEKNKNAP